MSTVGALEIGVGSMLIGWCNDTGGASGAEWGGRLSPGCFMVGVKLDIVLVVVVLDKCGELVWLGVDVASGLEPLIGIFAWLMMLWLLSG